MSLRTRSHVDFSETISGRNRRLCIEPLEQRVVLSIQGWQASLPSDFFVRTITEQMVYVADHQPYAPGEVILGLNSPAMDDWSAFFSDPSASETVDLLDLTSARWLLTLDRGLESPLSLVHFTFASQPQSWDVLLDFDALPFVEWASPNFAYEAGLTLDGFVSNDPRVGDQYHHGLMQNYAAWEITTGDPGVIVAVIDSGVQWNHPDLVGNIWINPGEIASNGIDDDDNGHIDDIRGWNFNDNDNNVHDVLGHGTHVAGIIAAEVNNGIGVAGTAGSVTLMPIRTSLDLAGIVQSYVYAADNGAKIVNMSIGIDDYSNPALDVAAQYLYDAGVLYFGSAGNETAFAPERLREDRNLFVASTDRFDRLSWFSNYGRGIDISAPGSDILSTFMGDGYGVFSGTSMASPNAAAVAALIWSANPGWTREQVVAQLLGTADTIDHLNPEYAGWIGAGRVNSYRALTETAVPPRIAGIIEFLDGTGFDGTSLSQLTVHIPFLLDADSANDIDNWELVYAGDDDLFGTGDDALVAMTISTPYLIGTREFVLSFNNPLATGKYRLRAISDGLVDPFGTPLDGNGDGIGGDDYFFTFTIASLGFDAVGPLPGMILTASASHELEEESSHVEGMLLSAGENVSLKVEAVESTASLTVRILHGLDVVANHTDIGVVILQNVPIDEFGLYRIEIVSDADTDVSLDVYRNATVNFQGDEELAIDASMLTFGQAARYGFVGFAEGTLAAHAYTIDLTDFVGQTLDLVLTADEGVEYVWGIIDPTEEAVLGEESPFGFDPIYFSSGILEYEVTITGVHQIAVVTIGTGSYSVVVMRSAVVDLEASELEVDPHRVIVPDAISGIGYLDGTPAGDYQIAIEDPPSLITQAWINGIPLDPQQAGSLDLMLNGIGVLLPSIGPTSSFVGAFIGPKNHDGPFAPHNADAALAGEVLLNSESFVVALEDALLFAASSGLAINPDGTFDASELPVFTLMIDFLGTIVGSNKMHYQLGTNASQTFDATGIAFENRATEPGRLRTSYDQVEFYLPLDLWATIELEEGLVLELNLVGELSGGNPIFDEEEEEETVVGPFDFADAYVVQLDEGESLRIWTETPLASSSLPWTVLDPRVHIYAPNGQLISYDEDSAIDGRNAMLEFTAEEAGTYRILVSARSGIGTYVVHAETVEVLTAELEWESTGPLPAMVWTASASEEIAADVVSIQTATFAAGENVSILVDAVESDTWLTVRVRSGLHTIATHSSFDGPVLLQNVPILQSGEYEIIVSANATTDVDIQVFRNATHQGGQVTQLSLQQSALALGNGARYAAVGSLDNDSRVDTYTVSLTQGQQVDFVLLADDGVEVTWVIVDPNSQPINPSNTPLGYAPIYFESGVLEYTVADSGQHTIVVTAVGSGSYSLVVGRSLAIDVEASELEEDPHRVLVPGAVAGVGYLESNPNVIGFAFEDENVLSVSAWINDVELDLQQLGSMSLLSNFGIIGISIDPDGFGMEFLLIGTERHTGPFSPNSGDAVFAGEALLNSETFVLSVAGMLLGADGAEIPLTYDGTFDVEEISLQLISFFSNPNFWHYQLGTSSPQSVNTLGMTFENLTNEPGVMRTSYDQVDFRLPVDMWMTVVLDQDLTLVVNISGVFGGVSVVEEQEYTIGPIDFTDVYLVELEADGTVQIWTETPYDAGISLEALDLRLRIVDPNGQIVATDNDSAEDGRNAWINFTPTETGVYRILVDAMAGAGAYVIGVSEQVFESQLLSSPEMLLASQGTSLLSAMSTGAQFGSFLEIAPTWDLSQFARVQSFDLAPRGTLASTSMGQGIPLVALHSASVSTSEFATSSSHVAHRASDRASAAFAVASSGAARQEMLLDNARGVRDRIFANSDDGATRSRTQSGEQAVAEWLAEQSVRANSWRDQSSLSGRRGSTSEVADVDLVFSEYDEMFADLNDDDSAKPARRAR